MTDKNYWIFQCNPKFWNFSEKMKTMDLGDEDTWIVNRYQNEMKVGDGAVIWQSGLGGGVYAFGEITVAPYQLRNHLDYQIEHKLTEKPPGYAIRYKITMLIPEGIMRVALLEDERFENLSILKSAMGTNFRVTQVEWLALQELAGLIHSDSRVEGQAITDKGYAEGQIKLVQHLRRERNSSLPGLKKAEFKKRYGALYCQKCGMNPTEKYGKLGEACIEVHHTLPVSQMTKDHHTKLEDLQCLCANCHRIEHALISKNKLH